MWTRRPAPHRPVLLLSAGLLLAAATGLGGSPAAWAHGDEDEIAAVDAVRQAIALLVDDPEDMEPITDKIADALESEETTGVDLALVERAQSSVGADRMMRARRLLERAIGARSDLAGIDMQPILRVPRGTYRLPLAVGLDTGTYVVTDELPGRGSLTGLDITLLALAVVLAATGLVLSVRLRPPDSVRSLRRQARPGGRT